MDLERLTPAPLRHDGLQVSPSLMKDARKVAHCIVSDTGEHPTIFLESLVASEGDEKQLAANAEFFILARNWLEVQERRKWSAGPWLDKWALWGSGLVCADGKVVQGNSALEIWQAAVEYDRKLTGQGVTS